MVVDGQLNQYAFIDESGDPNINTEKNGVGVFYVVTAVLVDAESRDELRHSVDAVRHRYFGNGEMKSSQVGSDSRRRRELLSSLVSTGIRFFSLVVDKSRLCNDSGLQYRKTFIKHIHGRLYKRLYRSFTSLHVLADEHGRREFMESFKTYMKTNCQKVLWDHEEFGFVSSCAEPLVQAADIIGGSLRRIYSGQDGHDLLDILSPAKVIVEIWPPKRDCYDITTALTDQERYDHIVEHQAVSLAYDFIVENSESVVFEVELQVDVLRHLLSQYELNSAQYINADELLRELNSSREEPISLQGLRSNIIAGLRSKGVIIASSNKGYKIPSTVADMDSFVSLVGDHTLPYLERLAQARRQILAASMNGYDIVSPHPKLLRCLDAMDVGRFG